MNNFYVYMYLRSYNSKHGPVSSPYYVGKGKGKRAWNKDHAISLPTNPKNIIIVEGCLSESDAFQLEKDLIKQYGRIDLGTGCLHNRTDGGPTSGQVSEETRAKMRAAKLGKINGPHDAEWNANIAASQLGKVVSPDTCARISSSKKGVSNPHSIEHCKNISKGKIGCNRPDIKAGTETRKKMIQGVIGSKRSPETILRMRAAALKREANKRRPKDV